MSQRVYNGSIDVFPTGLVEVHAYNGNREMKIVLSDEAVSQIGEAYLAAKLHNISLGHAFWHVKEGRLDDLGTCGTCRYCQCEKLRENQ